MKKIVEIDLIDEDDLYEKYNRKHVSRELINYIIEIVTNIDDKHKIKVIVNNKTNIDTIPLIKAGLKKEYKNSIKKYHTNNKTQIIFLLIGILLIFITTILHDLVFKEIFLIVGWVFIWEMTELELFSDSDNKIRRKALKRLMNSEIIETQTEIDTNN